VQCGLSIMTVLKNKGASGLQIAFLILAVLLLAVPADRYLFSRWRWAAEMNIPIDRMAILVGAGILFMAVAPLRRICADLLSQPIPGAKLPEVAAVTLLDFCVGCAALGAFALWWWWTGGQAEVARHFAGASDIAELEKALSIGGVVTSLLLAGLLAPIIEELVFRGLLYRAWQRQWGWFPAAIASSMIFALAHPRTLYPQFFAGLLEVCVYRRTGSLRAAILMHAVFNVSLWYPLAGQFVLPAGRESGRLEAWTQNFVCLAVAIVALPLYLWMSRDAQINHSRAANAVDAVGA